MPAHDPRVQRKTSIFIALVVLGNVAGNTFLARGLQPGFSSALASAVPWLLPGILLLAGTMIAQMLLLSWADLTYVLPLTATGYALTAIAGRVFLAENISLSRWAGVALITLGVALVTPTPARTAPPDTRA